MVTLIMCNINISLYIFLNEQAVAGLLLMGSEAEARADARIAGVEWGQEAEGWGSVEGFALGLPGMESTERRRRRLMMREGGAGRMFCAGRRGVSLGIHYLAPWPPAQCTTPQAGGRDCRR